MYNAKCKLNYIYIICSDKILEFIKIILIIYKIIILFINPVRKCVIDLITYFEATHI